jgi:hypothetical protein
MSRDMMRTRQPEETKD